MEILKIYALGINRELQREMDKLEFLLKNKYNDQYSLKIVNLLETPQLTEKDKIFTAPVLIKKLPEPIKNIINDLSGHKILIGLDQPEFSETAQ